ncbi:MAG: hypothetical protein MHPSP_004568, partial [Paramarteilia canceri]
VCHIDRKSVCIIPYYTIEYDLNKSKTITIALTETQIKLLDYLDEYMKAGRKLCLNDLSKMTNISSNSIKAALKPMIIKKFITVCAEEGNEYYEINKKSLISEMPKFYDFVSQTILYG